MAQWQVGEERAVRAGPPPFDPATLEDVMPGVQVDRANKTVTMQQAPEEGTYKEAALAAPGGGMFAGDMPAPVAAPGGGFPAIEPGVEHIVADRPSGPVATPKADPNMATKGLQWQVGPERPITPELKPETRDKPPETGKISRGMRNNNPGNIEMGKNPWQGEVQGDDERFATFDTPENGIRALAKQLMIYDDKHGVNTVTTIVNRYAPPHENKVKNYIARMTKSMGVGPNEPLDMSDRETLRKAVVAMIDVEVGWSPYSDATIDAGVNAALGIEAPTAVARMERDPRTPDPRAEIRKAEAEVAARPAPAVAVPADVPLTAKPADPRDELTKNRNQMAIKEVLDRHLTPAGASETALVGMSYLMAAAPASVAALMVAIDQKDPQAFAEAFADVHDKWSYHPQTTSGKYVTHSVGQAFSMLGKVGDFLGDAVMDPDTAAYDIGQDIGGEPNRTPGKPSPVAAALFKAAPELLGLLPGMEMGRGTGRTAAPEPPPFVRKEPTLGLPRVPGRITQADPAAIGPQARPPAPPEVQAPPVEITAKAPSPEESAAFEKEITDGLRDPKTGELVEQAPATIATPATEPPEAAPTTPAVVQPTPPAVAEPAPPAVAEPPPAVAEPPPAVAEPPPAPRPEAPRADTTEDRFNDFVNRAKKTWNDEQLGQSVLDDMEEKDVSPAAVAKQFWRDTYFTLPPDVQMKFRHQLKAHTGLKVGDVIEVSRDGKRRVAENVMDLADVIDLPSAVDGLEGTDRGFVALMYEANRRYGWKGEKTSSQPALPEPEQPALPAPEPELPSGFAGTLKGVHGSTRPVRNIRNPDAVRATRYDDTGGVWGNGFYSADPGDYGWFRGGDIRMWDYNHASNVEMSFKNAAVVSPETLEAILAAVKRGGGDKGVMESFVPQRLQKLGYDGVIVRGFKGKNVTSMLEAAVKKGLLRERDISDWESALMDQVVHFSPEGNVKVVGTDAKIQPILAERAKLKAKLEKVAAGLETGWTETWNGLRYSAKELETGRYYKPEDIARGERAKAVIAQHADTVARIAELDKQVSDIANERSAQKNAEQSKTPAPKSAQAAKPVKRAAKSGRDPGTMTNSEINRELEKLSQESSQINNQMIEAGRGHETPSDYLKKDDPLSMAARANSERNQALRIEASMRYGPDFSGRLGKGGARKKAEPGSGLDVKPKRKKATKAPPEVPQQTLFDPDGKPK